MAERQYEQTSEGSRQSDVVRQLAQLVRDAREEDSSIREKAIAGISPLVPLLQQALDIAISALNDPDESVRLSALHGLLEGTGNLFEWIDLKGPLADDDMELRLAAI